MSESGKSKQPRKKGSQGRRNGEINGSNTDPPHSETEDVDEPEHPEAEESLLPDSNLDEPDRPAGHSLMDGAWGLENGSELTRLLSDSELMGRVVTAMIENSKTVDKLRQALENDDELRHWLIDVLMVNEKFRRRLVKAMVKSLD